MYWPINIHRSIHFNRKTTLNKCKFQSNNIQYFFLNLLKISGVMQFVY
jgi:hypothetical protein